MRRQHTPGLNLRAGELVRVRSRSEILATLDADGKKDRLPFMPEMLQYCGKTFRVYKRADKACDTVRKTGSRRLHDAVHLEDLRCDGCAHGNCQAGCLIFWKEAWLKRVEAEEKADNTVPAPCTTAMCTEQTILDATRVLSLRQLTRLKRCFLARRLSFRRRPDILRGGISVST